MASKHTDLLKRLDSMSEQELRRQLAYQLTEKPLGLVWERDAIDHDRALNANAVLPKLSPELSHLEPGESTGNMIIEGDNFDALRLLRKTHAGKIRVIYIDPPYNTGNSAWVYNDKIMSKTDRYRQSTWLEFMYRRLELARDLLSSDGVILVSINDENRSNLDLLMSQVLPGRRVGSMVWRTKDTGNDNTARLSQVHEHILVYANSGFTFAGRPVDKTKYANRDSDPLGEWAPQPLTANKTLYERPNTYYPIQNPETGYWYPCDPDSVWRFASEKAIRERCDNESEVQAALNGLRSDTIEGLISKKLIYFPDCNDSEVMQFDSKDALLDALDKGAGPISPKKKTPLLRADLPDLDFWVGKPIAPGRPSRKDHWNAKPEEARRAPLSSWIAGQNETVGDEEDIEHVRSTRGGVANDEIKALFGNKVFQHAKPVTLMKSLLSQASKEEDVVLDFFAGSGTTAQAVMELNQEDGGSRRFILCSNTEATNKEPNKNLCRDICAERVRRFMTGTRHHNALGGSFAYLTLDLIEEADLELDATPEHAQALLSMRDTTQLHLPGSASDTHILPVGGDAHVTILVCRKMDEAVIRQLKEWPAKRVIVYSGRPQTLSDALPYGSHIESRALSDVFDYVKPTTSTAEAC
ncbi:site-specific DNA-methyltransferase [Halomonas sp. BC1]|uniref:site-specific DNA-methyltransferase n=1 Tax=Halomonas sp. BC1 TaxID=1670448 RepID=UPI0009BF6C8D|nr:site-specific DNA-methyltransferase [Halomonas sp. BC1]